ncbi:hypothetical protein [Micromonospora haikouensis]|uniref:hypothetical protein n=1 Tax=Micromonospora haikouensis TaxID=686309 RepID=UPI0037941CF5
MTDLPSSTGTTRLRPTRGTMLNHPAADPQPINPTHPPHPTPTPTPTGTGDQEKSVKVDLDDDTNLLITEAGRA